MAAEKLAFLFTNRAATTLALPVSNVDTTATLTSGAGALFPNPGAGQFFPMTFISLSDSTIYEIVYVTARSGDVITMTRAQEGTTALAWNAGDLAQNLLTAGCLALLPQPGRIRCTADLNLYVSASGNDNNDGLTTGTPLATFGAAYDILLTQYDGNGFTAFINMIAGTITNPFLATAPLVGFSTLGLVGSPGTPTNCKIHTTNSAAIEVNCPQTLTVNGFELQALGGSGVSFGVSATSGATITVTNIVGNSCALGLFRASNGGTVFCLGGLSTANGSTYEAFLESGGAAVVAADNVGITFGSGTAFTAGFANVAGPGYIEAIGNTFTGSFTGPRFTAIGNGVINTNTANPNLFPGSSAGILVTGGQYL